MEDVIAESDRYVPLNLNNYDLIPIIELMKPKEGARVILNRYWQSYDGKVLVYKNHNLYVPQCNEIASIVNRYLPHECHVVFIEEAFLLEK